MYAKFRSFTVAEPQGRFSNPALITLSLIAQVVDPWNELCPNENGNNCAFDRFVALKQQNPELKISLAVGGWNEGSEDFSMVGQTKLQYSQTPKVYLWRDIASALRFRYFVEDALL